MKYIVGFDGGGTKTRCVLGDYQGNIISDQLGGPSNHQSIGVDATKAVLKDLFDKTINDHVKKEEIGFIFLGLAGADLESDFNILNGICRDVFEDIPFEVVNDAWIIMRSGTKEPYGAVSIYGTGANAGAINKDGNMHILRALYYHLGGAGGGGEIIDDALHYAFRSNEKTYKETTLEKRIPELFGLNTIEELLGELYPTSKFCQTDYNKIPPLVFQLASEGDSVSKEILSRKGRTQGEMLNGVLTKSNMLGKKFPVVLGGSIYKGNSPEFIDAFKSTVLEQSPQATFHMAELEPVAGAYLFGLDRVNVTLDDNAFLKLKKSLSL